MSAGSLRRPEVRLLLVDAAYVLAWFVVLGAAVAVLWWQLTPLAEYTRTTTSAQMNEQELGRQVATDGWYVALAAIGGVLSGITLLSWRRRDPLATVVLVAIGSMVAAWVMLRVGLWLGPADPQTVLPTVADGTRVPLQLKPEVAGVVYVWPIGALLGAIGVIWGTDDSTAKRKGEMSDHEVGAGASG